MFALDLETDTAICKARLSTILTTVLIGLPMKVAYSVDWMSFWPSPGSRKCWLLEVERMLTNPPLMMALSMLMLVSTRSLL